MLLLPYQGDVGTVLTKSFKRNLDKQQPNNVKTQVIFTGQKISNQLNIKDMTIISGKHDVIYFGKCPEQNCTDNHIGESARKICEQIIDHGGRDKKSHSFQHDVVNEHQNASYNDLEIIASGFRNNIFKRKIAEALLIKELRPTLNTQ